MIKKKKKKKRKNKLKAIIGSLSLRPRSKFTTTFKGYILLSKEEGKKDFLCQECSNPIYSSNDIVCDNRNQYLIDGFIGHVTCAIERLKKELVTEQMYLENEEQQNNFSKFIQDLLPNIKGPLTIDSNAFGLHTIEPAWEGTYCNLCKQMIAVGDVTLSNSDTCMDCIPKMDMFKLQDTTTSAKQVEDAINALKSLKPKTVEEAAALLEE